MELPTINKYKLVKRKTGEYQVIQQEIVEYFRDKRVTYSVVGLWINRIGVRDVGELFRQVQKFDGKYPLKLKMNWWLKECRKSWELTKQTLK